MESGELQLQSRMASMEAAYHAKAAVELPKVELAYELLNIVEETPGTTLLDKRRRNAFGKIVAKVTNLFEA